jgi:hypothetical protein
MKTSEYKTELMEVFSFKFVKLATNLLEEFLKLFEVSVCKS